MTRYIRLFFSILLLNFVIIETAPSQFNLSNESELSLQTNPSQAFDSYDSDSLGILPNAIKVHVAYAHNTQSKSFYSFNPSVSYQLPTIRSPPSVRYTA